MNPKTLYELGRFNCLLWLISANKNCYNENYFKMVVCSENDYFILMKNVIIFSPSYFLPSLLKPVADTLGLIVLSTKFACKCEQRLARITSYIDYHRFIMYLPVVARFLFEFVYTRIYRSLPDSYLCLYTIVFTGHCLILICVCIYSYLPVIDWFLFDFVYTRIYRSLPGSYLSWYTLVWPKKSMFCYLKYIDCF